jgi:histidine triad (HIT) family protein
VSDCLFCSIVAGAIPADVVAERDRVIAFRDINPQAQVHVLVVPRAHHAHAAELAAADATTAAALITTAHEVAAAEGFTDYRLVFNTGAEAGQTVFHAHLHVLAGRSMAWPPG